MSGKTKKKIKSLRQIIESFTAVCVRRNHGRIDEVAQMPNLIEVQRNPTSSSSRRISLWRSMQGEEVFLLFQSDFSDRAEIDSFL